MSDQDDFDKTVWENSDIMLTSEAQALHELETATAAFNRITELMRMVGECGITEPETAREVVTQLEVSLVAITRWKIEAELQYKQYE